MRELPVYIEICGNKKYAGSIWGDNAHDARFSYDEAYANEYPAISVSLPVSKRTFDPDRTRSYFEGLLPEGFLRHTLEEKGHSADYLDVLEALGRECLGAVRIGDDESEGYRRLSGDEIWTLAAEGATIAADMVLESHLSLTGASGKVGLYKKDNEWYLPVGISPSTYIVKQSHVRYEDIVINEQLCMMAAKRLGIEVPESSVVATNGKDILFATKRYDRTETDKKIRRLHQEDFAQALALPKYETSAGTQYLKQMFEIIEMFSASPIKDKLMLWEIIVFQYFIGDTDGHLKNFSLLYSEDLRSRRLAPAYDLVCTMLYPGTSGNVSIAIGGKLRAVEITRDNFEQEARMLGISKPAMSIYDRLSEEYQAAIKAAAEELCIALPQMEENVEQMGKRILAVRGQ